MPNLERYCPRSGPYLETLATNPGEYFGLRGQGCGADTAARHRQLWSDPVIDALDNQLPAVFGRWQSGGIAVEIDTEGAVFPVRIGAAVKSISSSEDFYSWTGLNGHYFGYSAATAGDVNNDGYSDVVVGVPGYDQGAGLNSGVVHVCYGSASGPGSPMVDCSYLEGPAAHSGFGSSVATAGDVNGDGYSDIIVGAPEFDVSGSNSNEGGVWVFHGSAAGIVHSAAWSSAGDQVDAFRGSCVATAGDVNGDGYSDIVFSEPNFDSNADDDVGRVFVFRGSPTGVSSANFVPTGSNEGDYFGQSVSIIVLATSTVTGTPISWWPHRGRITAGSWTPGRSVCTTGRPVVWTTGPTSRWHRPSPTSGWVFR